MWISGPEIALFSLRLSPSSSIHPSLSVLSVLSFSGKLSGPGVSLFTSGSVRFRSTDSLRPLGDDGTLLHLCLQSQISRQRHLVAGCGTASPNRGFEFALFTLSSCCLPLFLPVFLSERRKTTTSPISSVAPPQSAVARPLGNQGRAWDPSLPVYREMNMNPCPPSILVFSISSLTFAHGTTRQLLSTINISEVLKKKRRKFVALKDCLVRKAEAIRDNMEQTRRPAL